ncbi:MAG: DegT/DnrJ/EryC1/StrS family aminotransferase, partial [Deltaproteobacteria bacterium]|nr:DegT/DnrJ/EryC1/StrS family aminotransferase [Deltaproteobacteria bacterium]
MLAIPLIKPDLPVLEDIEGSFREILENGKITNFGKYVNALESEASAYLDAKAITVSSGTAGLVFALQALGLPRGKKVIVPSFTFMATAQAVIYAGGIPVFAEIEDDLTISATDVARLLEKYTDVGAVIGTHTYGMPCHADELQKVVDEYAKKQSQPVFLMYDAAHAFGSSNNGRRVGSLGAAEVFSLSVTKMLVCVEGGMVTSRDSNVIERIRKMRNYGIEANYEARWPGMNGKMSEFHAIIGLYNLRRLDRLVLERQCKAHYYLDKIKCLTDYETLAWPEGVVHTFKDFTVLMPKEKVARRDAAMAFLQAMGIETRAYFCPPVHEQRMFKD